MRAALGRKALKLSLLTGLMALGAQAGASSSPEIELYAPAKTSFSELAIPVGVKAIGQGEAYTASGSDVYALHYNPAGLAGLDGFQLGLMHNEWSSALGLRQEFVTYGQELGQDSGLAASVSYFSLGSLQTRSVTGALGGESAAFGLSGALGYGVGLLNQGRLKLGASAEFGMESLFATSQSSFGGSVGMQYEVTNSFSMGVSLPHLGTGVSGFMPPSAANIGMAGWLFDRKMTLAFDGVIPFNGDPTLKAGTEINFGPMALRGGYRFAVGSKAGDVQSGPTAGAGFKLGLFNLDYAFVPYGELSTTHRVSATLALPADFFKPQVIGAASSTVTSKAFYDKAVILEKNKDLFTALVEYQRAKEAYPDKFKSKPQEFYEKTLRKISEIRSEMAKSGQSAQSRKKTQEYLSEAQDLLKKGRYRDAIAKANDVLKNFDENNAAANKIIGDARSALGSKTASYKSDAKGAWREGRTAAGIEGWRKVLEIDSSDREALAFFEDNKPAIIDYLKKQHRKGIDFYVSGKVEEALKVWKKALDLDPSDPIGIKRDIDKARKLIGNK